MSIPAIMIREESTELRQDERWQVCIGARWLDSSPEAQAITVIDVSASGFLIEVDRHLPVGTSLIVEMPGSLSRICRTIWNSGNYHGAQFSEPLSASELDNLLSPKSAIRAVEADCTAEIGSVAREWFSSGIDENQDRLPFATRARVIVGATAILWALLGTGMWLLAR